LLLDLSQNLVGSLPELLLGLFLLFHCRVAEFVCDKVVVLFVQEILLKVLEVVTLFVIFEVEARNNGHRPIVTQIGIDLAARVARRDRLDFAKRVLIRLISLSLGPLFYLGVALDRWTLCIAAGVLFLDDGPKVHALERLLSVIRVIFLGAVAALRWQLLVSELNHVRQGS
jgi:hypothetical protein